MQDCKIFKQNNEAIALNMLLASEKGVWKGWNSNVLEIKQAYTVSDNFILLTQIKWLWWPWMEKKCHYLAFTKLNALLNRITSKYYSNFYCLNCVRSEQILQLFYLKIETLFEKIGSCENNPKISFTVDVTKHTPYLD